QVPNYLPSISASISLSPESYIWRLCIGLHSAPRFLVAFTYFRFYKACFPSRFPENPLSCVSLAFSVCENLGLLLLTYVSSSETYFVHKEGFVLFIISSFIYMLTTCRLWKSIKKYSLSPKDAKSYRWKVRFLLLNISFCLLAALFYWKHNMYCESGSKYFIINIAFFVEAAIFLLCCSSAYFLIFTGYTFFALFEYLVVFTNMAFHLTSVWDFQGREFMVTSAYEDKNF
ncbi:unnamed protein product, partial [Tetraodon nigroviridis]